MPSNELRYGYGDRIMVTYRRADIPGGTYFFTVVTYKRRKIFTLPTARTFLRQAVLDVRRQYPFTIDAWVLLPDHLHCIWTLPPGDSDFSGRWGRIKAGFSKQAKELLYDKGLLSRSRMKKRESTIWQRRFWEHVIRDERDLRIHMDYIHYNPVKHGLVQQVCDWPYSTFHRLVDKGVYPCDWGTDIKIAKGTFGE